MKTVVVSLPLLENQVKDLLESNLNEDSKAGLHNFLGTLIDFSDDGFDNIKVVFRHTGKKSFITK